MFVVLLRFSERKGQAGQFMAGHKAWIDRGLEDGVFLLVGTIQPNGGGAILAHNISLTALEDRVRSDPFVVGLLVLTIIERALRS